MMLQPIVTILPTRECRHCAGVGAFEGEWSREEMCTTCEGTGEVPLCEDPRAGEALLHAARVALGHLRRREPAAHEPTTEFMEHAYVEHELVDAIERIYERARDAPEPVLDASRTDSTRRG